VAYTFDQHKAPWITSAKSVNQSKHIIIAPYRERIRDASGASKAAVNERIAF